MGRSRVLNPVWLRSPCSLLFAVFAALLFTLSTTGNAQELKRMATIGFLSEGFPSSEIDATRIEAFRQGLRELGYSEEKNISIEYHFAEGKRERLPALTAQLV